MGKGHPGGQYQAGMICTGRRSVTPVPRISVAPHVCSNPPSPRVAAHAWFFILRQSAERPDLSRDPSRFSSPILQAWLNTASLSSNSRCSLNRCHARLGQDRRELRLADHQRITPQVVAIQFDQVEAASPTVSSQGSGSMRGRFPPCSIARIAFPSPGQPPFAPDWLSAAFAYPIACRFGPFA